MPRHRHHKGFSLIELAVGLAIAGIMLAGALAQYKIYYKQKAYNTTIERKNKIEQALTRYLTLHRHLPCPADPALPNTHANAGKESCVTNCPNPQGLCRVPGARDTAADEDSDPDNVLVGSIPYASLGVSSKDAYDGWGSKFGYAVTETHARLDAITSATEEKIYNENFGVINVKFYHQDTGTEQSSLNSRVTEMVGGVMQEMANSFSFSLVSYGPDRKGGYTSAGLQAVPCTGLGRDVENCDGDAVFTTNDRHVEAAGADFYDDPFLINWVSVDSDKWEFSGGLMNSKNLGNVGIGTQAPATKLDVVGGVRADAVNAEKFCNEEGQNCFPAELIGGAGEIAGYGCGGGYIQGVKNGKVVCSSKIVSTSIEYKTCPTGEFIKSINAAGKIQCQAPGP